MGIMKRVIRKVYSIFLRLKWRLPSSGAGMLADTFMKDYSKRRLPFLKVWSIHRKGFGVMDWCVMGVTPENYQDYLSNADYYRMHPINGMFSKWIDDKLTLKYLCAGTVLDQYMPEYYYQIDAQGKILGLIDAPTMKRDVSAEDVASLLRTKGILAIKLISGSIGAGFYKGEYKNEVYYLNGHQMNLQEFCKTISALRNYIIIEYLRPHEELSAYCPDTVNCIRYLAGRVNGRLEMLKGYIRFGSKQSGYVENYNAGGVLCYLDQGGTFHRGNIMSESGLENCVIATHPDTGKALSGVIPMWEEILKAVEAFDLLWPQMKYLGFDFAVTLDHKVKVLEINSLTSVDGFQIDGPVFKSEVGAFYCSLMNKIG